MVELTPAQQVFAVFYAIFFGTMLSTVGARRALPKIDKDKKGALIKPQGMATEEWEYLKKTKLENASLNLFDTPNATAIGAPACRNKPFLRTIISILLLNIFPGFLFAIIFFNLRMIRTLDIVQIIFIVWMSLIPQQVYRLFYAILAEYYEKLYLKPEEQSEYNDHDLAAVVMLFEDRLKFNAHRSAVNHLAFPLFFYLPSVLLFYLILFPWVISTFFAIFFSVISIVLFLGGILFFLKQIKTGTNR